MRHFVLCALMAVTVLTTTDAQARHRRRCCYHTSPCAMQSAAPCGNACGTASYAPVNYAPIQTAACSPAQPVTYSAGYAPMSSQVGTTPMAPPPPQTTTVQPVNGNQIQAPPTPQPVDNN